jgi:PGF-pre-PGF domain-containing protein
MAALVVLASLPCGLALGLGTMEKQITYSPGQLASIKYYIVKQPSENLLVNLDFNGTVADYADFRIEHYWYSTRMDETDYYLQREFDLSNVSTATLKFYTKYDIEYGWDFGYIEVSTNNGSSWTQLAGTTTTTFRDPGAYVGVPGAPAYTGSVSSWTIETVSLNAYAGSKVLFRFRYVTDEYYAEHGWLVDDISLAEIGFADSVGSQMDGWSTNGWLHNVVEVSGNSSTMPLYVDFVIPDSYTYNSTEEKMIATEIPGVDADYNPGQSSAASIIVHLPPIVKSIPAPPSGGGGGGGSYSVKKEEAVQYIIDQIFANIDKIIDTGSSDTPVRQIIVALDSFVKDAEIRITPLSFKPAGVKQDLHDVYKYFDISTTGLYGSALDKVVIKIAVSKDWVRMKGVTRDDVVVSRYNLGSWSDLHTVFTGEDRDDYLYDSYSPGFSVFAVRVKSAIPEQLIQPVPTVKPDITQVKPLIVVVGNESGEEMIDGIKDVLRKKSQGTEEDMERVLGREIEEPKAWGWDKIGALGLLVFMMTVIIVIVLSRRLSKEKIQPESEHMPVRRRHRR